jgi:2-polyprenyl-3-methyl-5-hydroxy-6-metoxy-1,4-benzoquinol methylase
MTASSINKTDPARWEQRYIDGNIPWDRDAPDRHLKRVLQDFAIPLGNALEIGCGTGTNAIWMSAQGLSVLGLDVSSTAIQKAEMKAHAVEAKCILRTGNFLTDEIPEASFQFAYDRGVFHIFDEAEDQSRFVHRVAALLEPNGIWHSLLGSTDGPPRESGPPRRSAAEIATAVEPYFEILELSATTFDNSIHAEARAFVMVARRRSD